jgi:Leucine-rich repeat (LRR) protein
MSSIYSVFGEVTEQSTFFTRLLFCPRLIQENIFSMLPWEDIMSWNEVLRGYNGTGDAQEIQRNSRKRALRTGQKSYSHHMSELAIRIKAFTNTRNAIESSNVWTILAENIGFEPANRSRSETIQMVKHLFQRVGLFENEIARIPRTILTAQRNIQFYNKLLNATSRHKLLTHVVNSADTNMSFTMPSSAVGLDSEIEALTKWCASNPIELGHLTHLDVYSDSREHYSLTSDISVLSNLRCLAAGDCYFDVHPNILQLTQLTEISINQSFTRFPKVIEQMSQLHALYLIDVNGNACLEPIEPPCFLKLTNLTSLALSGLKLQVMPPSITALTNLQVLELVVGDMQMPENIFSNLTQLTSLELELNPPSISAQPLPLHYPVQYPLLTELVYPQSSYLMDMSECAIYTRDLNNHLEGTSVVLPESLCTLTSLQKLTIHKNHSTQLPKNLGNLASLQLLQVVECGLDSLPADLGHLTALQELRAPSNLLTQLPSSFVHLRSLKKVYLNNNSLFALPSDFGNLRSLEVVDLDNNHLTALPTSFCALRSLQVVSINNNNLVELPPNLSQLDALEMLDLSFNDLQTPQEFFQSLAFIRSIHLNGAFRMENQS